MGAIDVQSNRPIPAIQQIKLFSPSDWEEFIEEWATSLGSRYGFHTVERCAGAGDMGRDVVAYKADPMQDPSWINFQGKHYNAPLTPSEVYIELGKLCYYTYTGEYTVPELYYFAAPQGVGTKLSQLIKNPDSLRQALLQNWDDKCRDKITTTQSVHLDGDFKAYVENFDFDIFRSLSAVKVVEEHSQTRWHAARFQTGLPPRGPNLEPPAAIDPSLEARYVRQLLDAYGQCLGSACSDVESLPTASPTHANHLQRSREQFYSAESLRNFSRDTLPEGEYERLQDEIHEGVLDTAEDAYPHGFQRVIATIQFARQLQLTSHPLIHRMQSSDRAGICHQLANEDRLTWVI
ncbi:MAG: hypothetical protein EON58_03105 [Alphaproteobacteria bacterium]|nr:MAG: hypothetical protein EON58_03105 [Alphaproteobacteria bacterium]